MSSIIDNRIVNMRFNNKEFEKNAQQSTKTLDKLKAALNFKGLERSFDSITSASRNLTFGALNNSVATVSGSFSALEQVAIGALRRIGDQAVSAGERLIKSLTIEQIQTGFSKYEEEVGSVQTIMAATGKTVDEVQGYLDKLMWYTDETSYSFSDMASNIGKFTSAGVDLGDATEAMMGISNWAAISGQGISQASHAMYNLSQAMGSGAVKLIDWKSIELANMATREFKQQVLDTAVGLGTLKRVGDGLYETTKGTTVSVTKFNDSLQDQWFTSDVLVKVLKRYNEYAERVYELTQTQGLTAAEAMEVIGSSFTGYGEKAFRAAQEAKTFTDALNATKDAVSTGWLKSFELIVGNYEEAKVLWTDLANALYDVFAEPGNYRNEQFEIWATDMRGRARLLRGLYSIFDSFTIYLNKFHDAFADVFGQWDAKTLSKITTGINKLANEFEATGQKATLFYIVLKQAFNVLKQSASEIKSVLSEVGSAVQESFFNVFKKEYSALESLNFQKVLASSARAVINFVRYLSSVLTENDRIYRTIRGIFSLIHIVKSAASSLFKTVFPPLREASEKGFPRLLELIAKISDKITMFDKQHRIEQFIANLKTLPKQLEPVKKAFENLTSPIRNYIKQFKEVTDFNIFEFATNLKERLMDIGVALQEAGLKMQALTNSGSEEKESPIIKFFKTLTSTIDKIKEKAKTIMPAITKLGESFGGLWDAFKEVLADDPDFLIRLLLGGQAIGLIGGMKSFIDSLTKVVKTEGGIDDVKKTIEGPFNSLKKGIDKISSGIDKVLKTTSNSINAFTSSIKADILKKIAISIAILAGSLLVLSAVNPEALAWALGAITGLFADLSASFAAISKIFTANDGIKAPAITGVIQSLAISVLILAVAIKTLASLEPDRLAEGVLALQVLLGDIAGLSKIISANENNAGLVKAGEGMILLAVAVKILTSAVENLGGMYIESLVKGLLAVISLMSAIAIFMQVTSGLSTGIGTGIALVLLAASLKILASAVSDLGSLPLMTLGVGLGAIAVSLTILIAALSLMPKGALIKSASLLVLSIALNAIASAITALSGIALDKLGVSVLALVVVIMGLAIALDYMKTAMPGAKALVIASSAITTFAVAIKILSEIPAEGILTSMVALTVAMGLLAIAAVYLTPLAPSMMLLAGALALLGLGMSLIAGAVFLFATAMLTMSMALLNGGTSINYFLEQMIKAIPLMRELILSMTLSSIELLHQLFPRLIDTVLSGIDTFLSMLVEYLPGYVDKFLTLVTMMFDILAMRAPEVISSAIGFIVAVINGLVDAIAEHGDDIKEALKRVMIGALGALGALGLWIGRAALDLMKKLGEKIKEKKDEVWNKLSEAITDCVLKLKEKQQDFVDAGANIIDGIAEGIKSLMNKPGELLEQIGANLPDGFKHALGIASPSKVMASISKWIPEGIAAGIENNGKTAINAVDKMGLGVVESFAKYSALAADAAADDYFSQPTIRPVVDMSAVMGASGSVNGFFATQSMTLSGINGTLEAQGADLREQMNQNRIYNDSNVLASMAGLRSDINTLAGAMSEMQVVMDTGATVGALAPGMDKALGVRANLKGRRN